MELTIIWICNFASKVCVKRFKYLLFFFYEHGILYFSRKKIFKALWIYLLNKANSLQRSLTLANFNAINTNMYRTKTPQ